MSKNITDIQIPGVPLGTGRRQRRIPPLSGQMVYPSFPVNLAAAHSLYPEGSTVVVPNGSNGNQTITLDKPMTFVGASAGAVLGDVTFANASGHVELKDMSVGRVTIGPWDSNPPGPGATPPVAANNIKLTNLTGREWVVHYAKVITITGGDWSPGYAGGRGGTVAPIEPYDGYNVSQDILVSGGLYHDVWTAGGAHSEGIVCWGVNGLTIRGVTFLRCGGTGDIGLFFVDAVTSAADYIVLANVLIENIVGSSYWTNPFDSNYDAYVNFQISGTPAIPGLIVRNNSTPKTSYGDGTGVLYFARSVPGGTPKAPAAPAGWGR